jgi:hypothetical protein
MGYYINTKPNGEPLSPTHKADQLLRVPGAREIMAPQKTFTADLVCVVENGLFDAAAFCYSEKEQNEFAEFDGRRKRWLIVPDAGKLAGYTP